MTTESGCYR